RRRSASSASRSAKPDAASAMRPHSLDGCAGERDSLRHEQRGRHSDVRISRRRTLMAKRRHTLDSSRRNFLKSATLVGAATIAQVAAPRASLKALPPGPRQIAVETQPPTKDPVNQSSSGGDFMVDVLKTLDIDYLAMNCASSFRGLHEAVVNYGNNVKPE